MSTNTRAEAFAPASMGNVGVGFDILGLAFCEPGDTVLAERCQESGVRIKAIEGDGGVLPLDAGKNTASAAVRAFLDFVEQPFGVELTIKKGLPLASGLGSSAASAVAAVVAVNALFGEPLSCMELLPFCLEGEALVSGYHADNVGPSLLGGITLITGTDISQILRLPVPRNLYTALVTPNIEVPTSEARAVLPQSISLKSMVAQTGAVARLVDALYRGDMRAVAAAMECDTVIEPARAHLMPLLHEVRQAAKLAGALAVVISGAGPTLCAVCDQESIAQQVADVMEAVYNGAGIGGTARSTHVDEQGARVISVS